MSLNNEQMLPARVRNMRQMKDLLNAEDIVLAGIEKNIEEMYERDYLYNEILVNEPWLEKKLEDTTGGIVIVQKHKDKLCVDISIGGAQLEKELEEKVIAFLNRWLPAHLSYEITYEKALCGYGYYAAIWQDDDITTLRQVGL